MSIDFLEREEGVGRERHWWEKEILIGCLPYVQLTRDQTHNVLGYGMMFQPTELPGQSNFLIFLLAWWKHLLVKHGKEWIFWTRSAFLSFFWHIPIPVPYTTSSNLTKRYMYTVSLQEKSRVTTVSLCILPADLPNCSISFLLSVPG